MTDRIAELQALVAHVNELRDIARGRPHNAYAHAHSSLSTAAIDALPDLLAVARAAKALADWDFMQESIGPYLKDLRAALARLGVEA